MRIELRSLFVIGFTLLAAWTAVAVAAPFASRVPANAGEFFYRWLPLDVVGGR